MSLVSLLAEPTKAPQNVKILWIKNTCAKLSWKAIPCPYQNGRILQYLIKYNYMYELANGKFAVHKSETSCKTMEITLMNLLPNWKYSVRVAGVNQAGVGSFSLPLELITAGGMYQQTYTILKS